MEQTAELISAVASLAWPVLIAVLVYSLFEPIKGLVESARSRGFTVRVAGNELTMKEVSEQQRAILSDLQAKTAELQKQMGAGAMAMDVPAVQADRPNPRILWVDDQPRNNSFLIATLEDAGAKVDTALSTDEALQRVGKASYDAIISDMSRPEGERAGIELARKLKAMGVSSPLYILSGKWVAVALRQEALQAGVSDITDSATTLLSLLPLTTSG
ncbi:response regulator transcription factor [Lysobacter sp. TAF61]|uniref:response regulator transcription factor n=1 Tax=Lysobacter sp. TAF61 TaxID=3233072 RepID=UPI003F967E3B